MATTSAQNLLEKLEQRKLQEQAVENSRTQELLQQHEESLRQLSAVALATTQSVTQSQSDLLDEALKSERQLLSEHVTQLKEQLQSINLGVNIFGKKVRSRLTWMLMWPIVATVLVSLLMVFSAMTWSWFTVSQANSQAEQILSDQQKKLDRLNSAFCSSPAGRPYCTTSR